MQALTLKTAIVLAMALVLSLSIFLYLKTQTPPEMAYAEFRATLNRGDIESVIIDGQEISGMQRNGNRFSTFNPEDPHLIDELLAHQVAFRGERPSRYKLWSGVLMNILMFGVILYTLHRTVGPVLGFAKGKGKRFEDHDITVTFADVAGCDEAKADVAELVDYLKEPTKFKRLGGEIPRGILMMGPPGTGKTLLARAIAGEAQVPFFSMSGSDFVEMYVGLGASRVRQLFDAARKKAPCIIFIDEIDAVGRQRSMGAGDGGHQERDQTLNQLLVEMDGFSNKETVIVIAATNRPEILDKALLRPGRFDRQVDVGLPDVRGREAILQVHMQRIARSPRVDAASLARATPGFTGADLANLVNEAALFAARKDKDVVDQADFERSKDKILMGSERRSALLREDERRVTAYHEAGHALVGLLVPDHDPVYKVSIIPRGRSLGMTQFLPEDDFLSASRERLESQISTLYGGRIAEEVVFGPAKVTTGSQNDIERATEIARRMVTRWGFSDKVGPLAYGSSGGYVALGEAFENSGAPSGDPSQLIDTEVRALIAKNYERAEQLIQAHIEKLHRMADALIRQETLDQAQIDLIMRS